MSGPRFLDEPARAGEAEVREVPMRPVLMEPAAGAPAVIDPGWRPPELRNAAGGGGALGWLLSGVALLFVTWAGLSAVELAGVAFDRAPALGWAASVVLALAAGMAGWGAWVEWRGFHALAKVERLRGLLAGSDLGRARPAALAWVEQVAARLPQAGPARTAVAEAADMEGLRAALAHGVVGPLGEAAGALGTRAAWQGGALVALCPHPALDALIAGVRGLRLVREVAALHGLRPGTLATLALARRVAVTAAGTAGVEMLSQSLSDQLLQRLPVVSHLAAAVPGATLTAVRLYRLARVAALACSPLGGRGGADL